MDVQLLTDYERTRLNERQPLPEIYLRLPEAELDVRIAAAKAALGDRLVVLGHHYQRDEVIKFAGCGAPTALRRAPARRGTVRGSSR